MAEPDTHHQLVPLRGDSTIRVILPCPCISEVALTPEQVQSARGIRTLCAGCGGDWTLLVMTAQMLAAIGSQSGLPEGHVGVLIMDQELLTSPEGGTDV